MEQIGLLPLDQEDAALTQMPLVEANIDSLRPASGAMAPLEPGQRLEDTDAIVRLALDDMKAEDVVAIDLAGKTSLADSMIIASGRSHRHVGSIADRVVQMLKDRGFPSPRVEGVPSCDWVLIDAGDVIVHVFRPEVRAFYNLEKMWGAGRPDERVAV